LNEALPEGFKVKGQVTNKTLHNSLVRLAKDRPEDYVGVIQRLKHRGDEIATLEGISVGLDDIEPEYAKRDKILDAAQKNIAAEKDKSKHAKIIVGAQKELLDLTVTHPGTMTHMAVSGSRGSPSQLMKIVASPLVANSKTGPGSFLIRHSYAEGLTPAEHWTTAPEARANNVATVISVAKPGELAKVMVANLQSKVVTRNDCGTKAGIHLSIDDHNVIDRYLAADQFGMHRNTLVTPRLVQELRSKGNHDLLVRSPMTCAAPSGVCQMCMGHDEKGQVRPIGTNVGVRSAQAMTEPLTQMALSSKHAVLTIKEKKLEPAGFKGVLQLLEIPKNFQHEATLAPIAGTVGQIVAAAHGGHYIHVGPEKVYAGPQLTARVKKGDSVEAGDQLTDGIPHPAKLIAHKGIGAARKYFVESLDKVYRNEGVNLDRRHFELLARTNMNTVKLNQYDPHHPEFLKGEPVSYNAFRDAYAAGTARKHLHEAVGDRLGEEVFHHTVGTTITPSLANELHGRGVAEVQVLQNVPKVEFSMRSFAMNPLMEKDWMGRLGHRYLKNSILQGVHQGETSDIHGTHPLPAFAYGAELREDAEGHY
jgi:DNA-directed RNA polymerase subunit beta'